MAADEGRSELSERFVKLLVRDQERKPEASPIRIEAVYDHVFIERCNVFISEQYSTCTVY